MRPALRYEVVRLATVPATRVLVALAAIGALLASAGLCFVVDEAGTVETAAGATESLAVVLTRSPVTVFVAGLLGAMALGHDYRFGTIDTTLRVTPRRLRAFAAKALTVAACAAALAIATLAIGWAVALAMLGPDTAGPASTGILLRAQLGYVAFVTGWALVGLGLCAICASQTFATLALVLWPFVAEPALRGLASAIGPGVLSDAAGYLPYAAGQALSTVPRAGADSLYSGAAQSASPALAALVFVALTSIVVRVAATLFRTRPATVVRAA